MAVMMEVRLELDPQARRFLRSGNQWARQILGRALYAEAERFISYSQANYVPVATGALRASGHVLPPEVSADGKTISVAFGFGNSAVTYAIYVHERTGLRHPVGTDHFLEKAVLDLLPSSQDRVGADVRAMIPWLL